jgi:2-polyprenyl-6-hydroxyphenyl methylase / 3-demethylubiquinone-9 3-methyltransferase
MPMTTLTTLTTANVRAFFDDEARKGRRLLPDAGTASGFGSIVKYRQAAALMTTPGTRAVLDVGCSVGSIEMLFHLEHPECAPDLTIQGVDISSEAVARANGLKLPNCTFRAYDGATLPCADDSFDLVMGIEVIEHVADKPRLIAEIRRVLRPGGRVFLTTPNPRCWALRAEQGLERVLRWCAGRPAHDKDAFIELSDLAAMLSSAGFTPIGRGSQPFWPRLYVSLFGWGVLPPLPPRMLARYQRASVTVLGRRPLRGIAGLRLGWSSSHLWEKPR